MTEIGTDSNKSFSNAFTALFITFITTISLLLEVLSSSKTLQVYSKWSKFGTTYSSSINFTSWRTLTTTYTSDGYAGSSVKEATEYTFNMHYSLIPQHTSVIDLYLFLVAGLAVLIALKYDTFVSLKIHEKIKTKYVVALSVLCAFAINAIAPENGYNTDYTNMLQAYKDHSQKKTDSCSFF